jgi:hypothetical protein
MPAYQAYSNNSRWSELLQRQHDALAIDCLSQDAAAPQNVGVCLMADVMAGTRLDSNNSLVSHNTYPTGVDPQHDLCALITGRLILNVTSTRTNPSSECQSGGARCTRRSFATTSKIRIRSHRTRLCHHLAQGSCQSLPLVSIQQTCTLVSQSAYTSRQADSLQAHHLARSSLQGRQCQSSPRAS